MSGYLKTWLAVLGAVLYTLYAGLAEGSPGGVGFTPAEIAAVGTAFVGAFLTYISPNLTGGIAQYTKVISQGLLAVLGVVAGLVEGGLTAQEWLGLVILFGSTIGVFLAPAEKHPV